MLFIQETWIAAPPTAVFAFHEAPGAFERLVPPWERVEVVESSGSIRPGSRVVLRSWLGPIPLRWVAVHTEYEPPHLFADRQESGPFARWYHRHRFLDDGQGGTVLRDEVDCLPPGGWLGRVLGDRFLRRKLHRMFTYRHRVTRTVVEAAARPATRAADS